MAAAIQADSAAPIAVGAIASFAGDGKNPSHQERDMRSWLAKFTGIDFEPYEIFLTLKKTRNCWKRTCDCTAYS